MRPIADGLAYHANYFPMSEVADRIAENVARVRERIARAAARSGRPADAITLTAVTKYVGAGEVRALVAAGCRDIGENRPQQLWQKTAALADEPIRWHMVGHLQRNKVRRTAPLVSLLHSLDSQRLAAAIEKTGRELDRSLPVLIEVNISGEVAKHGLAPEEVAGLLAEMAKFPHVEVRGLMTVASLEGGLDAARADFAALRQLQERLRGRCAAGAGLEELSMGMSRDFEIAVEEGATIVRVGSSLFEGIVT